VSKPLLFHKCNLCRYALSHNADIVVTSDAACGFAAMTGVVALVFALQLAKDGRVASFHPVILHQKPVVTIMTASMFHVTNLTSPRECQPYAM
jgi:hypothetical protein